MRRIVGRLALGLAGLLVPALASASVPAFDDAKLSTLSLDLPRAAAPAHEDSSSEAFADLKTRVRGFDLALHCGIGGAQGVTCGARRASGFAYDGLASDISVFTGYFFSKSTGLYNAKARWYDPEIARFTTQDDFAFGKVDDPPSLHLYFYANDNPTRYVDPDGHSPLGDAERRSTLPDANQPGTVNDPALGDGRRAQEAYYDEEGKKHPYQDEPQTIREDRAEATEGTPATADSLADDAYRQIDEHLGHNAKVFRKAAEMGKVATIASQIGIAIAWSGPDTVLTIVAGTDINGNKVNGFWRALPAVGMGGAIFVRQGGRLFRILEKTDNFANDLRKAEQIEQEAAGTARMVEKVDQEVSSAARTATSEGRRLLPAGRTAEELRNLPGLAFGRDLPIIEDGQRWLRGSGADAGRVPGQIAERLSGRTFESFKDFREAFWREVAGDPVLRQQFGKNSLREMEAGRAPFAPGPGRAGGRVKYELDHMVEIQDGGAVYDLRNIVIRTPVNHIGK